MLGPPRASRATRQHHASRATGRAFAPRSGADSARCARAARRRSSACARAARAPQFRLRWLPPVPCGRHRRLRGAAPRLRPIGRRRHRRAADEPRPRGLEPHTSARARRRRLARAGTPSTHSCPWCATRPGPFRARQQQQSRTMHRASSILRDWLNGVETQRTQQPRLGRSQTAHHHLQPHAPRPTPAAAHHRGASPLSTGAASAPRLVQTRPAAAGRQVAHDRSTVD